LSNYDNSLVEPSYDYDDDEKYFAEDDVLLDSDNLESDAEASSRKAAGERRKQMNVLERYTDELFALIMERASNEEETPEEYPERWLFKGDPIANGERRDVANALSTIVVSFSKYTPVVYLLTFKDLIESPSYKIDSHFLKWGHHKPAMRQTVEIDLHTEREVFVQGFFNLINAETDERLTVAMDDEKMFVTSLKSTGEAELFQQRMADNVDKNDVFRGKTFTFTPQLHPKFVEPSKVQRSDVVLSDKIWKQVDINIINVFRQNAEYKKRLIPTKRGTILEGPPGNGKSMLVKYLENELRGQVTFMYVTDGIINGSGAVSRIFDLAQHYSPVVLIFEDVDSIGGSRDYPGSSSITPELLSRLDGLEKLEDFVIVATTNYPEKIDDALRNRPNRFDRRIRIARPEGGSRLGLLKKFLENKHLLTFDDKQLEPIAESLSDFSGAQIGEVVVTAQMIALDEKKNLDLDCLKQSVEFMQENYYDDAKIGKDEKKNKVGFRSQK